MLSGNAIHSTATQKTPPQSSRRMGRRAGASVDSTVNPIRSRVKVMAFGGMASSASAMKRKEAPQMNPGAARIIQSESECGERGADIEAGEVTPASRVA